MGKVVSSLVSTGLMIAGAMAGGPVGWALIAAGMATQVASSMIFKDKMPSMNYRDQSERKQMLRSAVASETIIVGKTICSGLLFFAEEEKGEQTENERLFLALAIAAHPVHKIGRIWLNDDLIETFGNKVSYEFHNGRTTCDPYMLKHAPSWKDDMIGEGLAWLRLELKYDAEKFPYGVPNVKVEVWGKEIYDPRTNSTAWTDNGALIILDYYRSYLGVPDADISFNDFKASADLSGEATAIPEGTEARYAINGAYELAEAPASVLEHMHKCIGAEPTYVAGKHGILMQAYNGPAVLRIEPSQIIDTVTITPELALRDATNAIYGTFIDAEQLYIKTDFEPIVIDEWIEEDGLEIKENIDFRFVSSPYQAARLSNLYLRKKRAGRRIQLKMNLDGYAYRPGDVILLNLPHIGIQNLEFRVAEWKFHPSEGVDITLEEDGPYIYEDIVGKPFERPPFTVLPTGGVAPPINLSFMATNIGEVVQGYLSWQNAAADVRYNTVNILESGQAIQTIQAPGQRVDLSGLVRGRYRAEVRSVNAAGAISQPTITDFDIQAPPSPVSVELTGGIFSLTAAPRAGDSAQHGYTFEFWFSDKKLSSTAEIDVTTKSNRLGQGQFWTKENLRAGTDYWFYIRTVNSYGKSAFIEAKGQASGTPVDMIDEMKNEFLSTEAGKQLEEKIDLNMEKVVELESDGFLYEDIIAQHNTQLKRLNRASLEHSEQFGEITFNALAEKGDRRAEIKRVDGVIANEKEARAKSTELLTAEIGKNSAEIFSMKEVYANDEKSRALQQQLIESKFKFNDSAILEIRETTSTLEGSYAEQKLQLESVTQRIDETDKTVKESSARITEAQKTATDAKNAQTEYQKVSESKFKFNDSAILEIRETTSTLENSYAEQKLQLESVTQRIDKTDETVKESSARITEAQKTATDAQNAQTEYQKVSESKFDEHQSSIAQSQQTANGAHSAVAKLSTELSAESARQNENINQANASLKRQDTVIATQTEALTQTKVELTAQLNESKAYIGRIDTALSTETQARTTAEFQLKTEIDKNTGAITRVESSVTTLQESVNTSNQQMYSQINTVDKRVTAVDQKVDETKVTLEGAIAQSNNLLSAKVETAQGTANTAKTNAANAQQDVDRYKNSNDQRMIIAETQITDNRKAIANETETRGTQINKINSQMKDVNSAIEQRAETKVDHLGNASATFTIKAGVALDGQMYDAKMMMGAEVKNGKVVTQIGFSADTFAILNPVNGKLEMPFFVDGGGVYMSSAHLKDGSITNAKIGNVIQSNEFETSKTGWQIDKNGDAEFNNAVFRGRIEGADGYFSGTVDAKEVLGDVYYATDAGLKGKVHDAEEMVVKMDTGWIKILSINSETFKRVLDADLQCRLRMTRTSGGTQFSTTCGLKVGVDDGEGGISTVYSKQDAYRTGMDGLDLSINATTIFLPVSERGGKHYVYVRAHHVGSNPNALAMARVILSYSNQKRVELFKVGSSSITALSL